MIDMDLKEEIRSLIAEILEIPADQLDFDTEMDEIAEWDSMRNVMILSSLEDKYDIMIPEDDIFDLVSVSAIYDEIKKLKA